MDKPRYFIDQRSGCIAVRDRAHTDPDYQGLHPNTPGVVWFRGGTREYKTCPTCNNQTFMGWTIKQIHKNAAIAERNRLNAKELHSA